MLCSRSWALMASRAHRCPRQGHAGHTISRKPGHRERNRVTRGAPAKVRQRLCHNGQRGGPQEQGDGGLRHGYERFRGQMVPAPVHPAAKSNRNTVEGDQAGSGRHVSLVDLTSCRREFGRCWMPERCPEQDCLDTCWMPWNAKRIQKRRAPRRSATLTACQNVPRHSMRDANHVRIKSMNSRERAGSLHDMPEKPKSGCNMTPNDHQSCLV